MSTTIDQRVVEMQFDNRHFEENVQTSLGSIEKLRQSLNLTGASKGLENVDAAAKNVNMTGLSGAVETVRAKFSALEVMGVTALANITNSAVNAGKRIVSALTIDPIKTGFSEYETQINAVQTILANTESKGTTITDVNKALDELNTYADKTIYNFTEMTRNIGTFTAAGVDLDTSVNAIQGIANLAAVSGSTSQQASTAMYQLSQALSSGTVKLMDWNSVVNAGMGGQVFQDALKETARVHGIAIDDMIEEQGSFRETLSEGWLTSEILTETLQKFTLTTEGLTDAQIKENREMLKAKGYTDKQIDAIFKLGNTATNAATKVKTFSQLWDTLKESAQSGWSQTWEIVVGDFEEAKETLTEFSNILGGMIEASSKSRNELLQGWKDAGGRKDLIESVLNLFEAALSIVKPIKEAFTEIFPPLTVDQLVGFTRGLKELTEKMKLSDGTADKLKRTFKGIFAVLKMATNIFSAVFKAVGSLFGTFGDLGGGILDVTAKIGDWLVKLSEGVIKTDIFNKALQGLVKGIKFVIKGISNLLRGVGDIFGGVFAGVTSSMDSVGSAFENWSLVKILKSVWNAVKTIASGLMDVLGMLFGRMKDVLGVENLGGIVDLFNGLVTGGIGIGLIKFINSLKGSVDGVSDIIGNFADIFGGLGGVLEGYQSKLKAESLQKIAIAIAILAASVLVLSLIDSEKLYDSVVAIAMLFGALVGAMALLNKSGEINGAMKNTTVMLGLATSVLILASALKKIADLGIDKLASGVVAIGALVAIMVIATKALSSNGKKAIKGATQMVIFAAAIKILASACIDLADLSWEQIAKGLTGVGVLLAAVAIFLKTAEFKGKAITTATGIVLLAAALKIMASACSDFAQMSWGELGKGLASVAALLIEVALFTKLTGNAKHVISTGIAMVAIAAAMKIFASAMRDFAGLSWEDVAKGLVAMAGALTAVIIALRLMPKNILGTSVGLIAVSTAMLIMASALGKMGSMSWEAIAKGMVALGGAIVILSIGLNLMKNTLAGSAALLMATAALALLTPVLLILGTMSWGSITKGLVVLAGAFTIMGIAGYALAPVVPAILGLAGALALIGVGVLALGVGLVAAGVGLSAIATGIVALVAAIGGSIPLLVEFIAATIVGICEGLANGIIAFCKIIIGGAPAVGEAIKVLVLALCDVLVECLPVIVDTVLKVLVALLDSLVEYTPKIVDALFNFLVGVIEGLGRNIPRLIKVIFDFIGKLFQGVIDALSEIDPKTLINGIAAVGLMAGVIAALAAITPLIPGAMAGVLGMGVVVAELALVLAAIGALAQIPGLKWLIDEGGDLLEGIGKAFGKLIGGFIGGIGEGLTNSLPKMASNLSRFMINLQPFIAGAKAIDESVISGVKSIINIITSLTKANLLEGITSFITGKSSIESFSAELPKLGKGLKGFSDSVAGMSIENVMAAVTAAKALAQMSRTIPNEGGIVSWFAGENSVSKFGDELPALGRGLKGFSDSVTGISAENIVAAANAAKAIADMASIIPNQGGVVSWFAGDNSIANFGADLITLGVGLKGFSVAISGIVPENMIAAANAAKSLSEMTSTIPNEGGMIAWFMGENAVSKFADDIKLLGKGLKGFSDTIAGIVPENITAAANAAKALAEMTAYIPNEGGMVSWFAGDNSVATFGNNLIALGKGLKGFSESITGIVPENIVAAANAAKVIAEMSNCLPNQGGVVSWFTGDNSLSKFGEDLISLGNGLKGFSESVVGIVPEQVTAAVNAAKSLVEITRVIPNQGGVVSWFTGDNSLANFGGQLPKLGKGLKAFSDSVAGIVPENITATANAAKVLAQMTTHIPNQGGVVSWFTGESSIANFANQLPKLGKGLKGFSDSVAGIIPEQITSAANAAKALAEMANVIPNEGGIKAWFTGENSIASFGFKLPVLGKGLKGFSDSVAGISPENVTAAANAAKTLAQMASTAPDNTDKIVTFGENLKSFGGKLKSYFSKTAEISEESISKSKKAIDAAKNAASVDSSGIASTAKAFSSLVKALKDMSSITASSTDGFVAAVKNLGKLSVDTFTDTFKTLETKMKEIGKTAMESFLESVESAKPKIGTAGKEAVAAFAEGMENKSSSVTSAISTVTKAAVTAAKESYESFHNAGSYVVGGFANGISENSYKAAAKARAMAKAAASAAEDELDINSPSKVGYGIGGFFGLGFVNAIGDYADKSYNASADMASSARSGLSDAISKVHDVLNSDMDMQPTIRPVLDLSDVRANAGAISGMLGSSTSVGVMAKVGAISSAMNNRNQNGGTGEVVDAIKALRKDLANVGGTTYSVNGITYDDGSNITDAVKSLVRAARIERRT